MNSCNSFEAFEISKTFQEQKVLDKISFKIKNKELVSIVGKSGTGKSTLIKICAGLIEPDNGVITFRDKDITYKKSVCGIMFQDDLLLPWFNIWDNGILSLKINKVQINKYKDKIQELFETFGLKGTEKLYPNQISGGMQKRVALLRTYLASFINSQGYDKNQPPLLLDEPFTGLDEITKKTMQQWLIKIRKEIQSSIIIVTHDIYEAISLSDRIIIIKGSPAIIEKEIIVRNDSNKDEVYKEVVSLL